MTLSIVKLMTQGDVTKLIDSIGERASTLQADIHTAAVNTLEHARVHGDNTGITRLMDKLPNGTRVKALAYWYSKFSGGSVSLSRNEETKQWQVNKDKFAKRADLLTEASVEAAEATTFADLTTEVAPNTLTLERMLKSMKRTSVNAEVNADGSPKVAPKAREAASKAVVIFEQMLADLRAA
jgi:hypothetical protein